MGTKCLQRMVRRAGRGAQSTHAELREAQAELEAIRKAAAVLHARETAGVVSADDLAEALSLIGRIAREAQ